MKLRIRVSGVFLFVTLSLIAAESSSSAAEPAIQLKPDSGHPWRPPFGLDRVGLAQGKFEADAAVEADALTNPVDLGAILVPHGWLLLGPGQVGVLDVAAIRRDRNDPNARAVAWFASIPQKQASASIPLSKGQIARAKLRLPDPPAISDRDVLHVSLKGPNDAELWHKTIPVMLVHAPPRWPHFGASYTKLRYDAPISIRDPKTGNFSSLNYENGWNPKLEDVVVSLPTGARFIFWRGSSYIPFWAGKHNTGACYEWAEMISRPKDVVDCVEPLMDKELRYGRVEIMASTPARVHVRWTYQSTDLHYKVWGDQAVEDYYFYPDGFGTRVLTLKADPANEYELSEFIILTPQGAYPLDVLPPSAIEALSLDGRKGVFPLPFRAGKSEDPRKALAPPAIYRFRFHKDESQAAICFTPMEKEFPRVIFGPFYDRGQMVTPCYWGSHWPLARGNATGSKIDDRITLSPCHNSVMSWAGAQPTPIKTAQHFSIDTLGRSRPMITRQWAWLIGMTDAGDEQLLQWARSFSRPPTLKVQGAQLDLESYAAERRALRLRVQDQAVNIRLTPEPVCVNPVFELLAAPKGELTVKRDRRKLDPDRYAWDGQVLWLNATIDAPTELRFEFTSARTGG